MSTARAMSSIVIAGSRHDEVADLLAKLVALPEVELDRPAQPRDVLRDRVADEAELLAQLDR